MKHTLIGVHVCFTVLSTYTETHLNVFVIYHKPVVS